MSTACILYGVLEGPHMGKRMRQALKSKGYTIIADPAAADLIITHSAGSLLLPKKVCAKQIIQIAPYWPDRPWLKAAFRKGVDDLREFHRHRQTHRWFLKGFWNFVYFWRFDTIATILRGLKNGHHWRHGNITTVVRPRFDSFCAPKTDNPDFKDSASFVSFPGYHDDCWRDPGPYLALIKN